MAEQPKTLAEFIDAIRADLVCDRCGAYIGGLALKRFKPAPYPVALGKIGVEDEAEALIGFEWYMVAQLRAGKFTVRHAQLDGACVSFREWAEDEEDALRTE
jgi:hypothetical protein